MNGREFHIDAPFIPTRPQTAIYSRKTVKLEEMLRHKPSRIERLLTRLFEPDWLSSPPPYMCSPFLVIIVLILDEDHIFCEEDDKKMDYSAGN